MESVRSRDDDASSVVIVTTAGPDTVMQEAQSERTKDVSDILEKMEEEKKGDDEEKKKKLMVRLVMDSKDLYTKDIINGDGSWTKHRDDREEAAEDEDTQKCTVIIQNMKPKKAGSTKPLVIDSIIIRSPYLKRVLGKVFAGYPDIVTDVLRLKFDAPFHCFFHRWDQFEEVKKDKSYDQVTREHIALLYKIMWDELGEMIQLREGYLKNRAVTFEHVWMIFPPGCTVYGSHHGKAVALRCDGGSYVRRPCGKLYLLDCFVLDWDGMKMGWNFLTQQILDFPGTIDFAELPYFPLEYHPRLDAEKEMLLQRGRKWQALAGYCHKSYKGTAIWHVDAQESRTEAVQSRIVIDARNWEMENRDRCLMFASVHVKHADDSDSDDDYDSEYQETVEAKRLLPLTKQQLLMTYPMVRGYALKNKRWMEFFVDDVAEVEFNDHALESLVLPADKKEFILAVAQSQIKCKDAFDDIVSGEGNGVVMLLTGGPGIGKTLTAESVAEEMKVPLYVMRVVDLGLVAKDVESNLGQIVEMMANWNAVLLLEECDVFLEERSVHDLARHRIVSIFLRMLERYQGILFLTTNRVEKIDPAFQSRIHMSLEYPTLDAAAREAVWWGFLGRAFGPDARAGAAHDITADEVSALAVLGLNGQQIKNVLKTANLLACHKGERLAFKHLQTVLRAQGHLL